MSSIDDIILKGLTEAIEDMENYMKNTSKTLQSYLDDVKKKHEPLINHRKCDIQPIYWCFGGCGTCRPSPMICSYEEAKKHSMCEPLVQNPGEVIVFRDNQKVYPNMEEAKKATEGYGGCPKFYTYEDVFKRMMS